MKLEEEEFYRNTKRQLESGEKIPKEKLIEFIILKNKLIKTICNNVFKDEEKKKMLETILEDREKLTRVIKEILEKWDNNSLFRQSFKYILEKKEVSDLDLSILFTSSTILDMVYSTYKSAEE